MKLYQFAHARAGDKGDTSNIALIAYRPEDYEFIKQHVTAERVKAHFGAQVRGEVIRYELPLIGGFNFVMQSALGGGVTRSLCLDSHGKSFGFALLTMELPDRQRIANPL